MEKHHISFDIWLPNLGKVTRLIRKLLPTPGNALFTLLVVGVLLFASNVGALSLRLPVGEVTTFPTMINFQGRLTDPAGQAIDGPTNMIFTLYEQASSGPPLWSEDWTDVNAMPVSNGLFNVLLGSQSGGIPFDVLNRDTLYLGITVPPDPEMTPRERLTSVPYALLANSVADASVTTSKLASGAVTTDKLADGAVTDTKVNLTQLTLSGDIQGNTVRATSQVLVQFPVSSGSAIIGPGNLVEAVLGEPGYVRLPTSAKSRYIVGVTHSSAAAGGTVWVQVAGIATVTSQTTIHVGDYVCNGGSPAPGQVVPCGSNPPQGAIVGIALNETSPGDTCWVLLQSS